jgi:hypothetical protein
VLLSIATSTGNLFTSWTTPFILILCWTLAIIWHMFNIGPTRHLEIWFYFHLQATDFHYTERIVLGTFRILRCSGCMLFSLS